MMDCFSIVLGLAFWFSKAYSMSNLCIYLKASHPVPVIVRPSVHPTHATMSIHVLSSVALSRSEVYHISFQFSFNCTARPLDVLNIWIPPLT